MAALSQVKLYLSQLPRKEEATRKKKKGLPPVGKKGTAEATSSRKAGEEKRLGI